MKKIVTIFIIVLISIGIADLLTGILLTSIFTPNPYSTSSIEMANFLQYTISAVTVTIALCSAFKVESLLKSSKSSAKVS